MKNFEHYYKESEEEMGEVSTEIEPEEAPVEEPEMAEGESEEGGETPVEELPTGPAVSIKLKDSVFIDDNGQLVFQLAQNQKLLTPDDYLNRYLPAVLTKEKFETKQK
jgi:hypothetical protein